MSSVGDLPTGGVQPVGLVKMSRLVLFWSLKRCFKRSRLLNSRVSLCMSKVSTWVGCGQKDKPLLSSVFSGVDSV